MQVADPLIISSRAFSSPACISETSTFFLHALFVFRDGCLYCCGGSIDVVMLGLYEEEDDDTAAFKACAYDGILTAI